MSYEYRLVFDDPSLMQSVIGSLKSSDSFVEGGKQEILLKDQLLQSHAEYDARLMLESDFSIWMEVNSKAIGLYGLMINSLKGGVVKCYEDGDLNDEVSLKEAFRIKV
ncbi:hypothetical protein [Variovorax guangxiensis]|uniref:Uncharacterized protein n=1 Tax=Variovorax guangxiensis TaxID=1775474 RepID=A0A840FTN1_9BURK|nr:hypothetical protein [Variovorax guangxiensis]MBB4224182.1 hypothetical protein [Variovorax guangxiensis]